jgi:hypothetical protein
VIPVSVAVAAVRFLKRKDSDILKESLKKLNPILFITHIHYMEKFLLDATAISKPAIQIIASKCSMQRQQQPTEETP